MDAFDEMVGMIPMLRAWRADKDVSQSLMVRRANREILYRSAFGHEAVDESENEDELGG
jgi:hypothetical protein